MRSYFDGLLRYFEFSGRSTRMQYWMFFLMQIFVYAAAIAVDYSLGGIDPKNPYMPATIFVMIFHVIPGLTVQIRRLHDIGKSGAWWLLNFVPFGGFVLLFWACCPSEEGSNAYDGPAPSTYEPRYRPQPQQQPRYSTIPRGVRMGNNSRTPSMGGGAQSPSSGRFI
ncbi:DUF805 domain-containing protein [Devosia lacusdianchii]|uniref:DUF805 domain-containing protein n=1 Tax=Devosia lacusdianchii TaxID=2917991 RepID=UPI001F06B977|nr:DUF805 domain-containing protein [Devosia sp. JXJ CY 41]